MFGDAARRCTSAINPYMKTMNINNSIRSGFTFATTFALLTTVAGQAAEPEQQRKWQSDWKQFTTDYPKTETQESKTIEFMEKDVVWKGKVKKVSPPKEGAKTGAVEIEMHPPLRLGEFSTDTISLTPSGGGLGRVGQSPNITAGHLSDSSHRFDSHGQESGYSVVQHA